jgi:signal transduction histidine kinase
MRSRLLWKLLGVNFLLSGLVLLVTWLALDYSAADYFAELMAKYKISPTDAHQMFLDAVHRRLLWACLLAVVVVCLVSYSGTRMILRPLDQMIEVTREFSRGNYSARVSASTRDEIGQFAAAFNDMADKLRQIQLLRKTMVLNVAHELRIPLTNIRGYLEGLCDGVIAPSAETFRSLREEALRLIKLVEDLLRLAQADAARLTIRKDPIDLWALIRQAVELFRVRFAAKGVVVATALGAAPEGLLGDPDKLAQVLANLLENAWQYVPDGGTVRVGIERTAGRCKVVFANSGAGIAADDVPFIFERFYRGDKSRSREHGGAGIGLAIVKELVEAHGGEVGAESSSGETRVWFTLPE